MDGDTGTYWLSRELLSIAGLATGDYQATHLTIPQLLGEPDRKQLPDAVFVITSPPARLVRHLAIEHRYKIVPLPYGDAFRAHALAEPSATPADGIVVRTEHVADAIVPAYSYGVSPAIPPQNIATVGSRLLLITHRRTQPGRCPACSRRCSRAVGPVRCSRRSTKAFCNWPRKSRYTPGRSSSETATSL